MGVRVRLLLVIESLRQGGAEQSTLVVLPGLVAAGIDVELLVGRPVDEATLADLHRIGVVVTVAPSPAIGSLRSAVRGRLVTGEVDVVHAVLFEPVIATGLAALGTPVPVLASVVNTAAIASAPDPGLARWKLVAAHLVEAASLHLGVDHVHAVTPGVARSLRAHHLIRRSKITVVERGRDPGRFRPPGPHDAGERAALGLARDEPLVLAVARHEHQKGLDVLVGAAGLLQAGGSRAHIAVAGREGTTTSAVRRQIASLPPPDRGHLLGDRDDVEQLYRAADVFVSTSWREGAAGAVVEAWGSGLPVVATDVAGLRGVAIDGVHATLVPIGDARAVADAIGRLLADDDLRGRRARAGVELFRARFSLDRAVEDLVELYRSTAGTRRGRLRSGLGPRRPS